MNKWFGKAWGAPVCDIDYHIETPVGAHCLYCDETIEADDRGMTTNCEGQEQPEHLECFMRQLLGSVAHLEKRCGCYVEGSHEGDDPNLTPREAARAALALWNKICDRREQHARN